MNRFQECRFYLLFSLRVLDGFLGFGSSNFLIEKTDSRMTMGAAEGIRNDRFVRVLAGVPGANFLASYLICRNKHSELVALYDPILQRVEQHAVSDLSEGKERVNNSKLYDY